MERDIRFNWNAIVEEAIRLRKEQKLNQKQLAALAGVSSPTVVRFERRDKNITLKNAFSIMEALGLIDENILENNEEQGT